MEITITGENSKHIKLVEELAKELGLFVSDTCANEKAGERTSEEIDRSKRLYQLMEEMAKTGAFGSIKDPVAWQREQRKGRLLPGRS